MGVMDFVKAAAQPLANMGEAAYNIYQDIRDFNYKRNLQETMFEREDNSLQRRMADARAAGLNPFDAAATGGAAAGSVVGGGQGLVGSLGDVGKVLDGAMAAESLKQAQEKTKQAQEETKRQSDINKGLKLDNSLKVQQARLNYLSQQNMAEQIAGTYLNNQKMSQDLSLFDARKLNLDLSNTFQGLQNTYQGSQNSIAASNALYAGYDAQDRASEFNFMHGLPTNLNGAPLEQYFQWQKQNAGNSAALLQNATNWDKAERMSDMIFNGVNAFGNLMHGVNQIPQLPHRRIGF